MNTLPNTYQQIDYIESTGTQYIDTGINADSKLQTIIDMQYTDISNTNNTNFGAIKANPTIIRYHIMAQGANKIWSVWLKSTSNEFTNLSVDLNRHLLDLDVPNGKLALDNNKISFTLEAFDTELNFWLFARNSDSQSALYYTKSKLYRCKMIYDGTIVRDFVPCYRKSDNTIGLYDLVNDVFYTNNGTGTFIKGNNVTVADKLSYLKETKEQIMEKVNNIDGTITDNTTFRQGTQKVVDVYNYYNNESETLTPQQTTGKANYLKETKRLYKDAINLFDENITNQTTFREYSDKLDDIYNNLPKVEMEGNDFQVQDTRAGKLLLTPKGNIKQEEEPTPDYPQDIKVVTGENNIIVRGKNLFNIETAQNYYLNHTNGTISANNSWRTSNFINIKNIKQLTFSWDSSSYSYFQLNVVFYDINKNFISGLTYQDEDIYDKTFEVADNAYYCRIAYSVKVGNNEVLRKKIQLEEGSIVTDYEEYIEPIEKELKLTSKNIFSYTGSRTTTTNGVTCKFENGILTFTGVASAPTIFNLTDLIDFNYINKIIKNNKFTTSLAITGISSKTVELNFGSASNNYTYQIKTNVSSQLYNYSLDMTKMQIYIPNETSFNNFVIKIQIEISKSPTSYEPYYNYELAKIGDYSDLIFKNEITNPYYDNTLVENAWYKKEKIEKIILNGTENWGKSENIFYCSSISNYARNDNVPYSNYFIGDINKSSVGDAFIDNSMAFNKSTQNKRLYIRADGIDGITTWLAEHNTTVYYLKDNPTNIQITETALINQLEEINKVIGKGGTVVIETESEEENAQLIVNAKALQKVGD